MTDETARATPRKESRLKETVARFTGGGASQSEPAPDVSTMNTCDTAEARRASSTIAAAVACRRPRR